MIPQSAGSQPDVPKKSPKDFLSDYVDQAIQQLQQQRIPPAFQQAANGQVPQDIKANPQNYS
jgi:hypothetical protein